MTDKNKPYDRRLAELAVKFKQQDEETRDRINDNFAKEVSVRIVPGKEPGTTVELKSKYYLDKLGRTTCILYVAEDGYLRGVKAADERAEADKQEELDGKTPIEITKKEYTQLLKNSETLHKLEIYGVDSWEGYKNAISDYEGRAK